MGATLQGIHPVLMSNDVSASVAFYVRLGFAVNFQDDPVHPKYVALWRDAVELHVQWAAIDQWAHPVDRPAYRILVSDVDALYGELAGSGATAAASNGGTPWAAPADTPWDTREFHVRDPGQNSLQFYRPL